MMGAVILSPNTMDSKRGKAEDGFDLNGQAPYTNFKRQLLKHVKTITIRPHTCPTSPFAWLAVTEGAKMMTGIKKSHLVPEAGRYDHSSPLSVQYMPIVIWDRM
jgi:hypothetical protein